MELMKQLLYITLASAMKQNWKLRKYSYLNTPRPDHGFLMLLKGRMDYITQDEVVTLKPNDLIFLPKDSKYEVIIHTEEGEVEDLLINFYMLTDDWLQTQDKPVLILNDRSNAISTVMEQTIEAYQGGEEQAFLAKSHFYMLCHHINSFQNAGSETDTAMISRAKALLIEREVDSIEEIAHRLLVSSSGFRRMFKETVGVSPMEFRLQKRLEKAASLLVSTDIPIKEIAEESHFYDTAYFYKMFKRYMGCTPKEYRKKSFL